MPKPRPRILCLHGAGSNDDITSFQAAGLGLSSEAECVYLHAPHTARCAAGLDALSEGPFYAWADSSRSLADQEDQWDQSLKFLARFCSEKGPFDGAYGFSQGAALITNFSHATVWKDGFGMARCPWRFAVLACGAGGHRMTIERGAVIEIPSFHIFGRKDHHLNDSKLIAEYWTPSQRVTQTHGGGHEITVQTRRQEGELSSRLGKFLDRNVFPENARDGGIREAFSRLCCGHEFYLCGITFGFGSPDADA